MKIPKANMYGEQTAAGEKIVSAYHCLKKGYVTKLHWHDFFELEVVIDGWGQHILNGLKYKLVPGSVHLVSHRDFHLISAETDLKIYNISFTYNAINSSLTNALLQGENLIDLLNPKELEGFKDQLCTLKELESENRVYYNIFQQNNLENLLIKMLLNHTTPNRLVTPSVVQNCILIIHNEFRKNISLEYAAEKLFLTPNYLGMIFKNSVGCSFRSYLNAVRVRYACNLLTTTDKTVKEIADECGYCSVEYFSYAFKRSTHISATKYRDKVALKSNIQNIAP